MNEGYKSFLDIKEPVNNGLTPVTTSQCPEGFAGVKVGLQTCYSRGLLILTFILLEDCTILHRDLPCAGKMTGEPVPILIVSDKLTHVQTLRVHRAALQQHDTPPLTRG